MAMPTATAPIGKPAGFTKPAGFAKPAGFGKPAADEDDDEPRKDHPVILTLAIVSVLLMALFCFKQYQVDQTPGRASDYLFGNPSAASSDSSYEESSDDSSSSDDEESPDESDEGESDEEE